MKIIQNKISLYFRPYRNKKRQKYYLKKYGSPSGFFNIISNNCIGGMCYHDAAKEFLSPTINLYVENFLTFISNLDEYLSCDIQEVQNSGQFYPVGVLNPSSLLPPITIKFVHYNSFEEAKRKWINRCRRMLENKGRLCIIYCVPKNKILDKDEFNSFVKIKAYRKLCFYRETSVQLAPNTNDMAFIKIPEKYQKLDYSKYVGLLSRKRYYDYFFNLYEFIFL